MEILDPNILAGLLTLIVLEIVLGIDNLVFIAILADRLPPHQRDRARIIGLSLALFTRLALLASIAWLVSLTSPVVSLGEIGLSVRDLILLAGGLFLLFKATMEIHDRLEGPAHAREARGYANFAGVIAQIIVLDIVFSLDSVITAVGMVDELWVMMTAVIVAIVVMIVASKPLTDFVGAHPTVVMLCLSFLLMIGLSLIAEAFHYELPKGYLYAAIAFSIMVETFNQIRMANESRRLATVPLRQRTTDAVLRLMGGRPELADTESGSRQAPRAPEFAQAEREMVAGVMRLGNRATRAIMTPRHKISWLPLDATTATLRVHIAAQGHSRYPVCDGEIDKLRGIVVTRDILPDLVEGKEIELAAKLSPPATVPTRLPVVGLIERLKTTPTRMAVVVDDHGNVDGLVTATDILAAIAGDLVEDVDTTPPPMQLADGSMRFDGATPIDAAAEYLGWTSLSDHADYATVAGFVLHRLGRIPATGDSFDWRGWRFRVAEMDGQRIAAILATALAERGRTERP